MTISVWQREAPREEIRCDVAVVGAGITGLSAAIECEARGLSCAIVESEWTGSKASGRNAGFLIRGVAENYTLAIERYGRERARLLWQWTETNLRGLRALGIESTEGFRAVPSCVAATEQGELEELQASEPLLREDGFESELVAPGGSINDTLWRSGRVLGGLLNPNDAVCSPSQLVRLLAAALAATPIIENAEVYRIEVGPSQIELHTPSVKVVASRVLLCTNAYAAQLCPRLRSIVTPNRGQMLACRPEDPNDAELACAYYLNHGSEYIRRGTPGELIIGGARTYHANDEATATDDTSSAVQNHLEEFVRAFVSEKYLVTARWSGIMGFSPDAMPVIGPVDPAHTSGEGRVWFCGGLTGHGMSMGYETGRHAVRVMIEGEHTMFALDRFDAD